MYIDLTMALPAATMAKDDEPSLMEDKDVAEEKTQNICVFFSAPIDILLDLEMSKQV